VRSGGGTLSRETSVWPKKAGGTVWDVSANVSRIGAKHAAALTLPPSQTYVINAMNISQRRLLSLRNLRVGQFLCEKGVSEREMNARIGREGGVQRDEKKKYLLAHAKDKKKKEKKRCERMEA